MLPSRQQPTRGIPSKMSVRAEMVRAGLLPKRVVHVIDHRVLKSVQKSQVLVDGDVERGDPVGHIEHDLQEFDESRPSHERFDR